MNRFSPGFTALTWYVAGLTCCLIALVTSIVSRTVFWFVFPFTNGMAIGLFTVRIVEARHRLKREKFISTLPRTIQKLSEDDEKIVLSVERNNGETVMVELPPEYDPHSDDGETLLRMVNPELFEEDE